MRKLLIALALAITPSLAWGQCTGVFPANTLCGNLSATAAPPSAFSASGSVIGPASSTISALAVWANTLGTQLGNAISSTVVGPYTWREPQTWSNTSRFNDAVVISGTTGISGTTTLSGTANLLGTTTLAGTNNVTGAMSVSGTANFSTLKIGGIPLTLPISNTELAVMISQTVKCNDGTTSATPSDCGHIAFSVQKAGTNQTSMTTGAYDQVTFPSTTYNIGGGTFASNRYTAPVDGVIHFSLQLLWTAHAAAGASGGFDGKVIKNSPGTCNGTDTKAVLGNPTAWAAAGAFVVGSFDVQATAGDVYELCAFGSSDTATNNLQIDGNAAHTFWQGHYVR